MNAEHESSSNRCCDVVCCQDSDVCSCVVPKNINDAYRLLWISFFLFLVTALFIFLGIFVPTMIQRSFHQTLQTQAILTPSSSSFQLFKDNSDYPMKLEVYIYNITNTKDVLQGAIPTLTEVGPFVYWNYRQVLDHSFDTNDTELSFRYYEYYTFDENLSVHSQDTLFTQYNLPFWGAASALLNQNLGETLDSILTNVKSNGYYQTEQEMAFTSRSVKDMLFGYNDDPMLNEMHTLFGDMFSSNYSGLMTNYTSLNDTAQRLKTSDTILTGYHDRDNTRKYVKYRNSTTIFDMQNKQCPWGDSTIDQCQVRGYDGGAIAIFENDEEAKNATDIDFWWPSLYRHINMILYKPWHYGTLKFYRFTFNPTEFQASSQNSYNKAYNMDTQGIMPLKTALAGSPMSCSYPHWIGVTNETYHNSTDIKYVVEPSTDIDPLISMGTYMDFESRTGSAWQFQAVSQLNLDVGKMSYSYDPWFTLTESTHKVFSDVESVVPVNINELSEKYSPQSCSFSPYSINQQQSSGCLSFLEEFVSQQQLQNTFPQYFNKASKTSLLSENHSNIVSDVNVVLFANMSSMPVPYFWGNQTGGVTPSQMDTLERTFAAVDSTVVILPIVFFSIAGFACVMALWLCIRGCCAKIQYVPDDVDLYGEYQIPSSSVEAAELGTNDLATSLDILDMDPIYGPTMGSNRAYTSNKDTNAIPPPTNYGYVETLSPTTPLKGNNNNYGTQQ